MTKPRRRPNMTEKLASALCEIRRGDGWLIPERLRLHGTAKEIVAAVQWDHATPWTWTADNRPQNLTPMARAEHAAKTARQRPAINKVRRSEKRRQKLAAEDPYCEMCVAELVCSKHGCLYAPRRADKRRQKRAAKRAAIAVASIAAAPSGPRKPKRPMPYTALRGEFKRDFRSGRVEKRARSNEGTLT